MDRFLNMAFFPALLLSDTPEIDPSLSGALSNVRKTRSPFFRNQLVSAPLFWGHRSCYPTRHSSSRRTETISVPLPFIQVRIPSSSTTTYAPVPNENLFVSSCRDKQLLTKKFTYYLLLGCKSVSSRRQVVKGDFARGAARQQKDHLTTIWFHWQKRVLQMKCSKWRVYYYSSIVYYTMWWPQNWFFSISKNSYLVASFIFEIAWSSPPFPPIGKGRVWPDFFPSLLHP